MKEGYIPRDERKKILLIADDIRVHSGVAQIAREFITLLVLEVLLNTLIKVKYLT